MAEAALPDGGVGIVVDEPGDPMGLGAPDLWRPWFGVVVAGAAADGAVSFGARGVFPWPWPLGWVAPVVVVAGIVVVVVVTGMVVVVVGGAVVVVVAGIVVVVVVGAVVVVVADGALASGAGAEAAAPMAERSSSSVDDSSAAPIALGSILDIVPPGFRGG